VHDPPLVGEHRLERHRLAARAHARRNAASDLTELLLSAPAIPLDVERNVDRAADSTRRDRRGDLLEGDEVLTATADERAEIRPHDLDALGARTIAQGDLRLDPHEREQITDNANPRLEVLDERRRLLLALGNLALLAFA
jgi:hypothetical protein